MSAGRVRVLVVNLHATSRAFLVIPWLWLLCARHRVDVVLLQEVTPRHRAWLRRRRRAWQLIGSASEAVYARRAQVEQGHTATGITRGWLGKHTGEQHARRSLPSATIAGWLRVFSVHPPPGWVDGPNDRVEAGRDYLAWAGDPHLVPNVDRELWAGDWNAGPYTPQLSRFRARRGLVLDEQHAGRIKHAATAGCEVVETRLVGIGPGMDHRALLLVVER